MALTVYTSKDNAWREYVNPLRGRTNVQRPTFNFQRSSSDSAKADG